MDIPSKSEHAIQFITNVGLITSNGPYGNDIMASEWTHHISYSPGLIMVCIGHGKTTEKNIRKTKEFGVNLASIDQNVIASISGNNHGYEVDKIKVLEDLGFKFSRAKKINTLMVEGSALQAECKLIKTVKAGDHTLFIGEVVELYPLTEKEPLAYHKGKFWKLGNNINKPEQKVLDKIKETIEKHRKDDSK